MSDQYQRHDAGTGPDTGAERSDILSSHPTLKGSPRSIAMMSAALHIQGRYEDAVALALAAVEAAPTDMIVHQTVRGAEYARRLISRIDDQGRGA